MDLPNEILFNVFSFLTQQSQSKFSCLWNLHNLSKEEIELIHRSNNLWFDTASKGYVKLMKLLIQIGVNVNIQTSLGDTSLHFASSNGHKEIVEILIKTDGININKQNNDGCTALHYASHNGFEECVKLLIENGADLNIHDNNNETALHWASESYGKKCTELLLSHGSNINSKNNHGNTSLHISVKNNNKENIEC